MRPVSSVLSSLREIVKGNVFYLGLVSLFTDLSSEMIYPLLPAFLSGIVLPGHAAIYVGLMDGIAESTSSLLKILSGSWSDRAGRRKPFAMLGYIISTFSRPLVALATGGWHVVAVRFVDRIGKGIRTSPRDALISESVSPEVRGTAFSFHRMMDHLGAVGGALLAIVFLSVFLDSTALWNRGSQGISPEELRALRWIFAIAFIPGTTAALVLWKRVREPSGHPSKAMDKYQERIDKTGPLPKQFYIFLLSVTIFTMGNSSDLFLIFYIQTRFGTGLGWLILFWVTLHVSKILWSLPGGVLSDQAGRRAAIICGWVIYILVYTVMPFVIHLSAAALILILYGFYYGMTEGAERALISDLVPSERRGRAYGLYHGATGLAAFPASLLFGVFWAIFGPVFAFLVGAALACSALLVLTMFVREKH